MSPQQYGALVVMCAHPDGMMRDDFYARSIRMPTVRALVKKGLAQRDGLTYRVTEAGEAAMKTPAEIRVVSMIERWIDAMASHGVKPPVRCNNCGGIKLKWHADIRVPSSVVDWRLRAHEVKPIFVLGCEECSETVAVAPAEEIAMPG